MAKLRERPRPRRAPWWGLLLAGFGYGILAWLAFPPLSVWPLAFVAPVPLLWAGCAGSSRKWSAAALVTIGVLPTWLFQYIWVYTNATPVGYPLLALYMSLGSGAFVLLLGAVRATGAPIPAALAAPILWTGLEVLRGELVFSGYPWFLAGHPLIEAPALAAPATLLGAYAVSFLLVALAGSIADLVGWSASTPRLGRWSAVTAMLAWAVLAFIGTPAKPKGPEFTVAVLQTALPQDLKLDWPIEAQVEEMERLADYTRQAAAQRIDLIAWPETMVPGDAINRQSLDFFSRHEFHWMLTTPVDGKASLPVTWFAERLESLQSSVGIPMLVGARAAEGWEMNGDIPEPKRRYNSVLEVRNGRILTERYDKMLPTPFGERIPLLWRFPEIQNAISALAANGMTLELDAGQTPMVFQIRFQPDGESQIARIVTPICFEATRASLCRHLVFGEGHRRADLMVNPSNDGWFGPWPGGRMQHLLTSRWTALQLGTPMIRAVNTGVSALVDTRGRIVVRSVEGWRADTKPELLIARATLPGPEQRTLYSRTGDVFAWVLLAAAGLLPLVAARWQWWAGVRGR